MLVIVEYESCCMLCYYGVYSAEDYVALLTSDFALYWVILLVTMQVIMHVITHVITQVIMQIIMKVNIQKDNIYLLDI